MSQFDLPRINFSGSAYINPGTANNNVLLPLVTYDPIQVKTVIPPRIYLSTDLLQLHRLGGLPIPADHAIHTGEDEKPYIEIETIRHRDAFLEWMKTPLGDCPLDQDYHELYQIVRTKRFQKPLSGNIPANWNFYGGMEFGFRNTRVRSVALPDQNGHSRLITPATHAIPTEIASLLGAEIDMNNDQGQSAAVMIDVLPTLALYSQVFCDAFNLRKGDAKLLQGRPLKASLRFLNLDRVLNLEGVLASSGTFFTVIPIEHLKTGEASPVLDLFRQYGQKSRRLRGIFIRYNLFDVWEDQAPDYRVLGATANPATATVAGSMSPWYEGEMRSISMGRQLLPERPFLEQKKLPPVVCQVDTENNKVILDLMGALPEWRSETGSETWPLGLLRLKLEQKGRPAREIGRFRVDPENFGREVLLDTGGIVELPFDPDTFPPGEDPGSGMLALYGPTRSDTTGKTRLTCLLRESAYMIASDQSGLYAEAGQIPDTGYRSYGPEPEACIVRVYHKGKPYPDPIAMTIAELRMTGPASGASVRTFLQTSAFYDGQTLLFPTGQPANLLYAFFPDLRSKFAPNLVPDILRTGFFVNLRVLPGHDYGKYLDPAHPEYPVPVSFELLYRELLEVYDLIYPVSSIITPFTEPYFRKGWKFLQYRLSPENWASATYMPSSRDMSGDQWALFCKWAEDLEGPNRPNDSSPLDGPIG